MCPTSVTHLPPQCCAIELTRARSKSHSTVSHDGAILGYTSELARLRDDDLTILVLLNATTLDTLAIDVASGIVVKLLNP